MENMIGLILTGWASLAGIGIAIGIAMLFLNLLQKLEMENLEWYAKAKTKTGATAPRRVDIRAIRASLGVKEEW